MAVATQPHRGPRGPNMRYPPHEKPVWLPLRRLQGTQTTRNPQAPLLESSPLVRTRKANRFSARPHAFVALAVMAVFYAMCMRLTTLHSDVAAAAPCHSLGYMSVHDRLVQHLSAAGWGPSVVTVTTPNNVSECCAACSNATRFPGCLGFTVFDTRCLLTSSIEGGTRPYVGATAWVPRSYLV